LKENDSSKVTKQMWSLVNGSKLLMKEYLICIQWCKVPYKRLGQSPCNP